jgi:hypothetical protein
MLSSESEPVTSHEVRWYARLPRDIENDFHTASLPNIRGVWTSGEAAFEGNNHRSISPMLMSRDNPSANVTVSQLRASTPRRSAQSWKASHPAEGT